MLRRAATAAAFGPLNRRSIVPIPHRARLAAARPAEWHLRHTPLSTLRRPFGGRSGASPPADGGRGGEAGAAVVTRQGRPVFVRDSQRGRERVPLTVRGGGGGQGGGGAVAQGAELKWYACGPTVYDSAHVGHARAYVAQDIMRRVLERHCGVPVAFVMGLTDVDDKIIQRAAESGIDGFPELADADVGPGFLRLARHFEREFFEDLASLGVMPPSAVVRVSEHIDEIVYFIGKLVDAGLAYEAADGAGVYFDISGFENKGGTYGKLKPSESHGEGAPGDELLLHGKRNPHDFALWKACPDVEGWASPWGTGRPGWHIECSAMTLSALGDQLDVHTGGIDLAFPHHCNEIAQSEAFNLVTETPGTWTENFLHVGHVHIKGRKMSKSLKNFVTVQEMLREHTAEHFRWFCLMHHYRSNVTFSKDRLIDAANLELRFVRFMELCGEEHLSVSPPVARWDDADIAMARKVAETRDLVDERLCDDFDTRGAIEALLDLINACHTHQSSGGNVHVLQSARRLVKESLDVFGLTYTPQQMRMDEVHARALEELVAFRDKVRKAAICGDAAPATLALCDELRDHILPHLGIQVGDSNQPDGGKVISATASPKNHAGDTKCGSTRRKRPTVSEFPSGVDKCDMFRRMTDWYSAFCEDGVPTRTADGEEVSKSERKRLVKLRTKALNARQNKQ